MFLLIINISTIYAGENNIIPYGYHKITLLLDNDAYFNQYSDKYYSAGQRIGYITKEYDFHNDNISGRFFGKISLYPKNNVTSFSININQEIYTPENKSIYVSSNDHPYAGSLYLSFIINQRRKYSLERIGISLGVAGEYSFAQ